MFLVGLTGGIGSGKSTVAAMLAERGAHVIDADAVARAIVEPGRPALAEILDRFGPRVARDDGSLDRAALAEIVFRDADARRDLEGITHPRIAAEIGRRVAAHGEAEREEGRARLVVIDHPLLVESGMASSFPVVVVVVAPEAVRVDRLVQRGLDRDDVLRRIAAQAGDDERRAAATDVIDNGGGLDALRDQVDALHGRLRRLLGDGG